MRALKVALQIRVRLATGQYRFSEPVWKKNRTLREGYAPVDGKPECHPEGVFYLRFQRGKKRIREAVGPNADAAVAALHNKQHDPMSVSLGRVVSDSIVDDQPSSVTTVKDAIDAYLTEVRRFRMPKTVSEYERMLGGFKARLGDRKLSSITREDLLDHRWAIESKGNGPRTVYNYMMRICALLRANGITGLLKREDKPAYDEPEVEAYDTDQVEALFAAAAPEERLLFQFFLQTGFRDQEVMFSTWKNVDFKGKVIKVRSKPELGFRPKDKEERSVPVPDELIAALAERKRQSTSMFIFPGTRGAPNVHFLRTLKKLAYRSGLNCGECINKSKRSCRNHATCGEWGLHKFRKTFATMHNDAGVRVTTIQRWLGHSDLATTLRYIAIADLRSERTRSQVNATFANLNSRRQIAAAA